VGLMPARACASRTPRTGLRHPETCGEARGGPAWRKVGRWDRIQATSTRVTTGACSDFAQKLCRHRRPAHL
jgi:hypothetical protein